LFLLLARGQDVSEVGRVSPNCCIAATQLACEFDAAPMRDMQRVNPVAPLRFTSRSQLLRAAVVF
jgi:hypothetical protein